jgi:hypothetical protein
MGPIGALAIAPSGGTGAIRYVRAALCGAIGRHATEAFDAEYTSRRIIESWIVRII